MGGRSLLLGACLVFGAAVGQAAAASVPIVDVIRKGLPPFPPGGQTYVLEGGRERGLRPGDLLAVRRPGVSGPLGWLEVTEAGEGRSEARLVRGGERYLLIGDRAARPVLDPLPPVPSLDGAPLAHPEAPAAGAEAPPREGLLFFLPQQDGLSPAGQRKLAEWVADWGVTGRWAIQMPAAKGLSHELQQRRTETLRTALRVLGVAQAEVDDTPRTAEGNYDPAWIRHWD